MFIFLVYIIEKLLLEKKFLICFLLSKKEIVLSGSIRDAKAGIQNKWYGYGCIHHLSLIPSVFLLRHVKLHQIAVSCFFCTLGGPWVLEHDGGFCQLARYCHRYLEYSLSGNFVNGLLLGGWTTWIGPVVYSKCPRLRLAWILAGVCFSAFMCYIFQSQVWTPCKKHLT